MSERLLTILQKLKTKHYECDDCYYSCPKCEEGCCNEYAEDECNCGADEQNALVDEAISIINQLTAELDERKADAERLATFNYSWGDYVACPFCHNDIHKYDRGDDTFHTKNCPITLHRQLVAKYGGEK